MTILRGDSLPSLLSDTVVFKNALKKLRAVIDSVGSGSFRSPFSLVPLFSQLLGLESPLMGTGGSPFSLISFASRLPAGDIFREEFLLPVQEKRLIVEEFYGLVAPVLLGETEEYIELLRRTRYGPLVKQCDHGDGTSLISSLREKAAAVLDITSLFPAISGDFAHIVHYGFAEDLSREHPFLTNLSGEEKTLWLRGSYPVVIEMQISGLNGSRSPLRGWIIFIANASEHLVEDEGLRKKKLLQSALLAQRLGARIVGLGGLVASFSRGGNFLAKRVNIGFTTGHAYTIGNILRIVEQAASAVSLDLSRATVAVLGAAGSIGSGCARLLASRGCARIILIDLEGLVTQRRLALLENRILADAPSCLISRSTSIDAVKEADIVIVATSAVESLVEARHLKTGAIVIDDSFPKNVPLSLLSERPDVILLEGGITQLPLSLDIDLARNVPDLLDAPMVRFLSTKQTYGCFAETLVLSASGHKGIYGLGDADPALAAAIMEKAGAFGFSAASLQCFGRPLTQRRRESVQEIIRRDRV